MDRKSWPNPACTAHTHIKPERTGAWVLLILLHFRACTAPAAHAACDTTTLRLACNTLLVPTAAGYAQRQEIDRQYLEAIATRGQCVYAHTYQANDVQRDSQGSLVNIHCDGGGAASLLLLLSLQMAGLLLCCLSTDSQL
jgi:hypothetical protein